MAHGVTEKNSVGLGNFCGFKIKECHQSTQDIKNILLKKMIRRPFLKKSTSREGFEEDKNFQTQVRCLY